MAGETSEADFVWLGQQAGDASQERRNVERFLEQSADAGTERAEELVGTRCSDDDRQHRVFGGKPFEGVPAVLHWHSQVEQHEVNWTCGGKFNGLLSVAGGNYDVSVFSKDVTERLAHGGVIDQEDAFGRNEATG